jgi:hypothetical protein
VHHLKVAADCEQRGPSGYTLFYHLGVAFIYALLTIAVAIEELRKP